MVIKPTSVSYKKPHFLIFLIHFWSGLRHSMNLHVSVPDFDNSNAIKKYTR